MRSAKSSVAAEAALAINPALRVRALQNRVSPDTEDVFDDAFWGSLDMVVRCHHSLKWLLPPGKATSGVPWHSEKPHNTIWTLWKRAYTWSSHRQKPNQEAASGVLSCARLRR